MEFLTLNHFGQRKAADDRIQYQRLLLIVCGVWPFKVTQSPAKRNSFPWSSCYNEMTLHVGNKWKVKITVESFCTGKSLFRRPFPAILQKLSLLFENVNGIVCLSAAKAHAMWCWSSERQAECPTKQTVLSVEFQLTKGQISVVFSDWLGHPRVFCWFATSLLAVVLRLCQERWYGVLLGQQGIHLFLYQQCVGRYRHWRRPQC